MDVQFVETDYHGYQFIVYQGDDTIGGLYRENGSYILDTFYKDWDTILDSVEYEDNLEDTKKKIKEELENY